MVRYADTNGYELDAERPHAWRYRDYVVQSFNQDKPYDLFLKEQIAGDELYPKSNEALIATGFHRAGPIHLVGGNQDEAANRQEVLSEMSGAIGSVFLGMTVGCAKLPQPQVRSHSAGRLLPLAGHLRVDGKQGRRHLNR